MRQVSERLIVVMQIFVMGNWTRPRVMLQAVLGMVSAGLVILFSVLVTLMFLLIRVVFILMVTVIQGVLVLVLMFILVLCRVQGVLVLGNIQGVDNWSQ